MRRWLITLGPGLGVWTGTASAQVARAVQWLVALGLCLGVWTGTVSAQVAGAVGVAGRGSSLEVGGEVDARIRLPEGAQFGVSVRGARTSRTYLGGYAEGDGGSFDASLHGVVPLFATDALEVGLRLGLGARSLWLDAAQGPYETAARLTSDFGPVAALHVDPHLTLRLGWTLVVEAELDPTVEISTLGARLVGGALVPIGEGVMLYGDVGVLGTFGFGGDNEKLQVDGTLGVRWAFGAGSRGWRFF